MTKVTYLSGAEHRRIPDQLQIAVGCSEDLPDQLQIAVGCSEDPPDQLRIAEGCFEDLGPSEKKLQFSVESSMVGADVGTSIPNRQ
jgi:hypothetical protein